MVILTKCKEEHALRWFWPVTAAQPLGSRPLKTASLGSLLAPRTSPAASSRPPLTPSQIQLHQEAADWRAHDYSPVLGFLILWTEIRRK
jgi:hypothetical protein